MRAIRWNEDSVPECPAYVWKYTAVYSRRMNIIS